MQPLSNATLHAFLFGQSAPVPGGEQNVLGLDVAVTDVQRVALLQRLQQLEGQPPLLERREKRPRVQPARPETLRNAQKRFETQKHQKRAHAAAGQRGSAARETPGGLEASTAHGSRKAGGAAVEKWSRNGRETVGKWSRNGPVVQVVLDVLP